MTKCWLIESPKSRAHFAAIANQHELDESATETLLNLLHDLGRIVYYGGDEGLCDSVVIKPEWLTKAIGYVLEDRATREAKGELQHSRLREIWYEHKEPTFERYAPASHPFFLRLMEKFDISYRLPEENASLVGQLVPYEQPELPWLEDSTLREGVRELCLFFSLNEEAPGLIPWLLVRNHRFSKGLHWRRGAFLAHRGHDALMNEAHTAYGVVTHRAGPFP